MIKFLDTAFIFSKNTQTIGSITEMIFDFCLFFFSLDFVDIWVCDKYNEQIHVDDEQIYGFCCFLNFFLIFWIFFKNKYVKPLGMPHQDSI
jgi:hypothetical protein